MPEQDPDPCVGVGIKPPHRGAECREVRRGAAQRKLGGDDSCGLVLRRWAQVGILCMNRLSRKRERQRNKGRRYESDQADSETAGVARSSGTEGRSSG